EVAPTRATQVPSAQALIRTRICLPMLSPKELVLTPSCPRMFVRICPTEMQLDISKAVLVRIVLVLRVGSLTMTSSCLPT
ncbi:hypothetical protein BG015_005336, partial [Linnemannia schmuckeri]